MLQITVFYNVCESFRNTPRKMSKNWLNVEEFNAMYFCIVYYALYQQRSDIAVSKTCFNKIGLQKRMFYASFYRMVTYLSGSESLCQSKITRKKKEVYSTPLIKNDYQCQNLLRN